MEILLGLCGEGSAAQAQGLCRALSGFPTVRSVRHTADDTCLLARGTTGTARSAPSSAFVFDGWLANREELCRALGGLDPAATGDGDIVRTALARWKDGALARLHGDFALARWTASERRLLLACARTGGRPLFYHEAGGRLVFSNLLSALFLHPAVERSLDPGMLAVAAAAPLYSLEDTCFAGVRQVLPGFRLDWSPMGGARVGRYWQPDLSRRIRLKRDADYVEAARELLDTVVGEAGRAPGPLAATLSGGLDSPAVAATAARLTAPQRLVTLTLRPDPSHALPPCRPRQFQDEWGHAQAVARMHPSMEPHGVEPEAEGLEETLRTGFFWTGRPPVHLLAPHWMRGAWRRARQLGIGVVLEGSAGNGTLSASAFPTALRAGPRDWPEAVHAAFLAARLGRPALPFLRAMAPEIALRLRDRLLGREPLPQDPLTAESGARAGAGALRQAFAAGRDGLSLARRARLRTLENTWLGRSTIAGLRFRDGIERRDPLGDVRLAEFCLAIPSRQFTRFGADRHLARRVLADRLPPDVLHERRIGRQNAEWFGWATHHRAFLAAELDGIAASPLGRELIDVPRLRRTLDTWPQTPAAAEARHHEVLKVMGRGIALGGFIRWAEGRNL